MTQKNNKIQSACTIISYLSLLTDFEAKSRDLGTTIQAQKTTLCTIWIPTIKDRNLIFSVCNLNVSSRAARNRFHCDKPLK